MNAILLFLACTGEEVGESGDTEPFTSTARSELAGTVQSTCQGDELTLQIGFVSEVPRVEADVTVDASVHEIHAVPFAGMDEITESSFIYEAKLKMGASEAVSGTESTFDCADAPVAGFFVYDAEGGIMGCYIGDFVVDYYDATGCPTDE